MKTLLLAFFMVMPFSTHAQESESEQEWPIEYVTIKKVDYPRNHKASFCKRPPEIVDTIVLHHTETPATKDALFINDLHLARTSGSDLWYMVAYTYLLNAAYPGTKVPASLITEGRPIELVGAHAGTDIFVDMDEEQSRAFAEGKITCGTESTPFKVDPSVVRGTKMKANVTTIGVVVIGNYSPVSRDNPGGYSPRNPRFPTDKLQDDIAKLSCQLQKKYPRIKNIRWHSYYHSTSCPGTIKNYIGQIKARAKELGCEFN